MKLKRGDIVRFKSGGLPMVVTGCEDTTIWLLWQDKNGVIQRWKTDMEVLEPVLRNDSYRDSQTASFK